MITSFSARATSRPLRSSTSRRVVLASPPSTSTSLRSASSASSASMNASAQTATSLHKLRASAVALVHEALTHARKWPTEQGREDRGLRSVLVARFEAQLAQVQAASDANEVAVVGARVQSDLRALLPLLRNERFAAHKLSEYVVPEVVQRHEKLLSTRNQAKIVGRRFGWLDRIMTWYLSDPASASSSSSSSSPLSNSNGNGALKGEDVRVQLEKRSGERESQRR